MVQSKMNFYPLSTLNNLKEEETLKWREQGYYHKVSRVRCIVVKSNADWVNDVADQVGLDNCGFVFYRMDQLDIMPPHIHFETIVEYLI